jgi:uncharacterized protein YceK
MKILFAVVCVLVSIILSGCTSISTNNQGIDVSGHISYEYEKSF